MHNKIKHQFVAKVLLCGLLSSLTITVFASGNKSGQCSKVIKAQKVCTNELMVKNDAQISGNLIVEGDIIDGNDNIFEIAGDYTEAVPFDPENVFVPAERAASPFSTFNINTLSPAFVAFFLSQITDPAQKYQFTYYLNGNLDIPQEFPVSIERMERLAEEAVGKYLFADFGPKGVAGKGEAYWQNLKSLEQYKLLPHMASGAASKPFVYAHTVHFGSFTLNVPTPIFVCPMGGQAEFIEGGELLSAQGATAANVSFTYSSASLFTPEEVKAADPNGDLFFQLYATSVPALNQSLIHRAISSGYKAVVLTLDTCKYPIRERGLEFGFYPYTWKANSEPVNRMQGLGMYYTDPVFNSIQAQQTGTVADAAFVNLPGGPYPVNINNGLLIAAVVANNGSNVVWDVDPNVPSSAFFAIDWFLNEVTTVGGLPLILKGILREDDARRAVRKSVAGVYVSNHGGRQIGGDVAAIDVLHGIAEAVKDEAILQNVPKPAILFDSGIRRGSDVLKAYALGAEWVGVGRPVLYGLAAGGQAGVTHVLQTILTDMQLTTQNMGYTNISQVNYDDVTKIN